MNEWMNKWMLERSEHERVPRWYRAHFVKHTKRQVQTCHLDGLHGYGSVFPWHHLSLESGWRGAIHPIRGWYRMYSSSQILEENVLFVLQYKITRAGLSLLYFTSTTLTSWLFRAFWNITTKGCPTDESDVVKWTLCDCRTYIWWKSSRFWGEMR